MPSFDWWDYNLWHFLRDSVIMFIFLFGISYIILRVVKSNRVIYAIVHPVVTFVFGSLMVVLFFFLGWVVPLNIGRNPDPIFWVLGLFVGSVVGVVIMTRIYLIEEENIKYRIWIYLLAIVCGIITCITEMYRLPNSLRDMQSFVRVLVPVPLMYLGYLGIKIRIRYLQKRRINRWREEGLKR